MRFLKRHKKILFLLLALLVVGGVFPFAAEAKGLIPCGGDIPEPRCNPCHIFSLLKKVFDFLVFQVTIPLATVAFMAGGFMFLLSAANPQLRNQAKNLLRSAVIGVAIVLLSWTIVGETINLLAGSDQPAGFPWPWNNPQCTVA